MKKVSAMFGFFSVFNLHCNLGNFFFGEWHLFRSINKNWYLRYHYLSLIVEKTFCINPEIFAFSQILKFLHFSRNQSISFNFQVKVLCLENVNCSRYLSDHQRYFFNQYECVWRTLSVRFDFRSTIRTAVSRSTLCLAYSGDENSL